VIYNVEKMTTIEEMMATLAKLYEKFSALNNVYLMKKPFNLRM
jgi:benzoyl-CoA reductase/2-hydroxyglutaryl-CoA dehydratase subunit BcrC/BadD/HgdB